MVREKKLTVVLPAFNAAKTLTRTYREIPLDIVDEVILVDDKSTDQTVRISQKLGIRTIIHNSNLGYGANQKSCYTAALNVDSDIVVMLHPDYQYTPKLITSMAFLIESGEFDVVLGSRILGGKAIEGGMPRYKYYANRFLTLVQNLLTGAKLSEYHTGYRVYSKRVLQAINWYNNSDGFIFDNQFLCQILYSGFKIAEVTCPANYFAEASSINFINSVKYGFGCIWTALAYRINKMGVFRSKLFNPINSNS